METKINLLFDGRAITSELTHKTSARSGIFFTALNLLKSFLDDERYNVSLYISDGKQVGLIRRFFSPQKLTVVTLLHKAEFIINIHRHKQTIRASKNIFKKALFCLKILKNLLRLTWYGNHNPYSKILEETNVFLSPANRVPEELREYSHIRRFIVIYDLIPFLGLSCYIDHQSNDQWFYDVFKNLDYDGYFFASENTKRDFIRFTSGRIDEEKMLVTHIAAAHDFVPLRDKEKLALVLEKYKADFDQKNKYIFSLCSLEPRKNLIFTINCFIKFIQKNNIDDLYFLLGGAAWDNYIDMHINETNSISGEHKN
jgi:hypothetical protein